VRPDRCQSLAAVRLNHPCRFGILFRMPRGRKPRLKIPKEARRRARAGIGLPPPERVIVEKRDKPPKHKKSVVDLIEET
jgi:hypothetical protein